MNNSNTYKAIFFAALLPSCASQDLLTSNRQLPSKPIYIPYSLPEGLLKVTFKRAEAGGDVSLEFGEVQYRPDPEYQFFLEYGHSSFSEDDISVQITDEGYLKSITAKTEDQTGEVVSKVIELATEVAKAGIAIRSDQDLPPFSYTAFFDPTDAAEREEVKGVLGAYGVDVKSIKTDKIAGTEPLKAGRPSDCTRGACFRPAQPHKVTIKYANKLTGSTVTEYTKKALVTLPNDAPVLSVRLDRYAFVEAETKVSFNNGMLTKVELKKPSEAVGFMEIPIDVAKSIVSIPSALFDFKVSGFESDEKLLDAQADLISSQIELSDKQAELLAAQAEAMSSMSGTNEEK
ncbi:MAG: hypothetical protein AAFR03_16485 [Pseudomonadota bacterium]